MSPTTNSRWLLHLPISTVLSTLSIMNILAFLIAAFSISITALLSDNSDPTDAASLSLDLPLSGSLSPDIPDQRDISSLRSESPFPSPLSLNPPASLPLDPSLFSLSPQNPTLPDSSFIDNPDVVSFGAADVPQSIAFNPNIDPNPSANSVDQPSIADPSPGYTEAKTSTDDSNPKCDARSHTSRKRKKRDDEFCMTLESYLFLPNLQEHSPKLQDDEDEEGKTYEEIRRDDKLWERQNFPSNLDEAEVDRLSFGMSSKGRNACNSRSGGYLHPLCCLGPTQFDPAMSSPYSMPPGITMDLLPPSAPIMNVYRCIGFLFLRPYCTYGSAYCCKKIRDPFLTETWRMGFHGLDCIRMPALVYP